MNRNRIRITCTAGELLATRAMIRRAGGVIVSSSPIGTGYALTYVLEGGAR